MHDKITTARAVSAKTRCNRFTYLIALTGEVARMLAVESEYTPPLEPKFLHRACDGGFFLIAEPEAVPYVQRNL